MDDKKNIKESKEEIKEKGTKGKERKIDQRNERIWVKRDVIEKVLNKKRMIESQVKIQGK